MTCVTLANCGHYSGVGFGGHSSSYASANLGGHGYNTVTHGASAITQGFGNPHSSGHRFAGHLGLVGGTGVGLGHAGGHNYGNGIAAILGHGHVGGGYGIGHHEDAQKVSETTSNLF